MRELASRAQIGGAPKEGKEHFVRREADAQIESEVAIIGNEDIRSSFERHRRAGLNGLVTFAC